MTCVPIRLERRYVNDYTSPIWLIMSPFTLDRTEADIARFAGIPCFGGTELRVCQVARFIPGNLVILSSPWLVVLCIFF